MNIGAIFLDRYLDRNQKEDDVGDNIYPFDLDDINGPTPEKKKEPNCSADAGAQEPGAKIKANDTDSAGKDDIENEYCCYEYGLADDTIDNDGQSEDRRHHEDRYPEDKPARMSVPKVHDVIEPTG